MKAAIIGGGIAGPVTAMALRKAGIEASVYEAYADPADGIGGGLSIAPNGINALAVVGADHAVRAAGYPMPSISLHSWTGKLLGTFNDLPHLPASATVMRTDLYRALHDCAAEQDVKIHFGHRLQSAAEGDSGVEIRFANGVSLDADILIGADGIRSTVRSLINPAPIEPRYSGLLGFGGMAPDLGLGEPGGWHMYFGKKAFFAYQVLPDRRTAWFANLPHRSYLSYAEATAIPNTEWLASLTEVFSADRTPAVRVLSQAYDMVNVGPMHDLPTVPVWHRGRMVLVGDAAHATSPSSGQGASLAAESAVELARCLRDLPVSSAFSTYEALRRPRVEKIIAAGHRTNNDKAAGPVARVLRDLLMPAVMKLMNPGKAFQAVHGYQIDWDAQAVLPLTRSV
ncbi:FAD-dependent monooxygenase [Pseudonocardiaceae bacterium YIM PH 21723]|nr:FAD-dependent monooxygenase [Pseudonocardiaceae bacterium YIM PH 21723]